MSPQRSLLSVAAFAVAGQVLLLLSAALLPLVSRFTFTGDTISELALGRFGGVQTAAFVIAGLGTLALSALLRVLMAGSRRAAIGCTLISIYGAGALICAVFPTDQIDATSDLLSMTRVGTIHIVSAILGFVSMVAGMFVMTSVFNRNCRWRSIATPSLLLSTSALSLMLAISQGPLTGVMQRLLVGAIAAWLIITAIKARSVIDHSGPWKE